MEKSKRSKFDPEDLELLTSVVAAIPNLTEITHATKLVNKRLKYPIHNRSEILKVFDGKKNFRLGDRGLSVPHVEQFLSEKFFPIDSERDLICKLLIAFQIGDIYHNEELSQQTVQTDAPASILPGPTYNPAAYAKLRGAQKEVK
ncbi:MAG TPA: hypothetical protein VN844_19600 [Pyrinomonadaceae bacterium]|nr:hypothetical protein [Pyrinomonadaceae bacterium]